MAEKFSSLSLPAQEKKVKNYRLITQSSFINSVHLLDNFIHLKRRVLLVVLLQVCVVLEGLIAFLAVVNARLVVHQGHVLSEVRRCFAHVIALPAAEWLRIHVDSAEDKVSFFTSFSSN